MEQILNAFHELADATTTDEIVRCLAEVLRSTSRWTDPVVLDATEVDAAAHPLARAALTTSEVVTEEGGAAVCISAEDVPLHVLRVRHRSAEASARDVEALAEVARTASWACANLLLAGKHEAISVESAALHAVMEGVAAARTAEEVAEATLDTLRKLFGWEEGVVVRRRPEPEAALRPDGWQCLALASDRVSVDAMAALSTHGRGLRLSDAPGGYAHAVVWPLHGPTETDVVLLGERPFGAARGLAELLGPLARLSSVARGGFERVAQADREAAALEAQRANRAKSEFLSRMSHELRTPLNAVLGFAQLLEMESLDDDAMESVMQIRRAGTHLLALVNEVLDIARIESGRMSMSLEPLDLAELVDECRGLVASLAEEQEVTIGVDAALGGQWVLGDRQRTKQVLLNLLSNAIKYNTPRGSIHIAAATCDNATDITVSDTGHGIPESKMERLFVPFDRLGAEAGTVEGIGLGLPLSRRLSEAMGGQLSARSQIGEGSTFTLRLPAGRSPFDTPAEPAHTESVTARRATILYIEDNLPNLKLIQRILCKRPGVELIHALSGGLGLDLARSHQPTAILLDLDLPDLHGRDVLARLNADGDTADIPVVVASADATPGQIRRLLDAGATAYLTKPLDVREFLSTMDDVLDAVTKAPVT